jgi:hypothetical protein
MRTFRGPGLARAYEQHLTGNGPSVIGDCSYIGVVPLTLYKKPECRDLTPAELLHRRVASSLRGNGCGPDGGAPHEDPLRSRSARLACHWR